MGPIWKINSLVLSSLVMMMMTIACMAFFFIASSQGCSVCKDL